MRVVSRTSRTSDVSKSLVKAIQPPRSAATSPSRSAAARPRVIDYTEGLYSEFPRALVFIVGATYLVLLLLFPLGVLPLKALVMDTLSILASYGALVVVFQDGMLAGLLGFQPLGFIEASLPIVMFCVLFGLSMDYEVFLL